MRIWPLRFSSVTSRTFNVTGSGGAWSLTMMVSTSPLHVALQPSSVALAMLQSDQHDAH